MRLRSAFVVLLLAAAPPLASVRAAAEAVSVTGANGAAGADGADGNPGADGGPGGDGESVEAIADAACEDNSASARGGKGGVGGDGGDGVPTGVDGGDGGAGGDGGDATARATGTCGSSVTAIAVGGDGGAAGSAGSASSTGTPGEPGAIGVGGDAYAEATLATDQTSLATASATAGDQIFFSTRPGNAATSASTVTNLGGGAESTATAIAGGMTADAHAEAVALAAGSADGAVTATALASGTGAGGDTTADARGTSDGSGAVTVAASAYGGGEASTSTATAYGSNAGSAPVVVEALATNLIPAGGFAFAGGNLIATAEGHSSGGGDVTVEATAARGQSLFFDPVAGPEVVLHDAVSGSTSGRLTLRQTINLNLFFGGNLDIAGDAITSLNATNPGGGALSVDIAAFAGRTRDAVLGDILATSVTGADVDIDAFAAAGQRGGRILQENRSLGISPTPSRIHAESNGGGVRTAVGFGVGDGYHFSSPFGGEPDPRDHPDGVSIDMENIPSGDTTGALTLEQTAIAGNGASEFLVLPAGSGGSARSALAKHTASESLELRSEARAGSAGLNTTSEVSGGVATAIVEGANSAGAAQVSAKAVSGMFSSSTGRGGDAVVEASASTTGDGHEVVVGGPLPQPFSPSRSGHFAAGGSVGACFCPNGATLSSGGNASSTSTGTAAGDSLVIVFDNAVGGNGGSSRSSSFVGVGGAGGDATSTATATQGGASAVKAKSEARGGAAGTTATQPGRGGDAAARATATGLGIVEASALAIGGRSGLGAPGTPLGPVGSATAHATADGASGFARAEASTGFGAHAKLRAQSEALLGSRSDVATAATHGAALASAPADDGLEGMAFFTGTPLAEDVDTALARNGALASLFAEDSSEMLALARWEGAGRGEGDSLVLSTELELVMSEVDASRKLVLGAFDTSVLGDGFESLSFSLTKNGVALGETQSFDTEEAVMAFFTGTVLDLGTSWAAGDALLASFSLTLDDDTRFAMGVGFATAVPEPRTGLLLLFGLVVLAQRRSTRAARGAARAGRWRRARAARA